MKNFTNFKCIIGLLFFSFFFSCENSNEVDVQEIKGEKVNVDNSGVEMKFNRFNEDGKIVVDISNKMNKNIDEFKAEILWLDKNGNQITYATGLPKTTPIQQIESNIAPSGRKIEFVLAVGLEKAPKNTEKVKVELKKVIFDDKTEWLAN